MAKRLGSVIVLYFVYMNTHTHTQRWVGPGKGDVVVCYHSQVAGGHYNMFPSVNYGTSSFDPRKGLNIRIWRDTMLMCEWCVHMYVCTYAERSHVSSAYMCNGACAQMHVEAKD